MLEQRTTEINRDIPVPLYYQLKELILAEIKDGQYKRGDAIPTEFELSELFGLSRTTVRQAIAELVQEGWLYRIKSKGTFVGSPKISQNFIRKIESYNNTILHMGMTPSTKMLALKTMKGAQVPRDVLQMLQLSETDRVIFLSRERYADGEPMVLLDTYLPHARCEFILSQDFDQMQLYELLAASDATRIFRVDRTIEAVKAQPADADLLHIRRGSPVLYTVSTGYNVHGTPIEYSIARYRGDRGKFDVTVFPEDREPVTFV